MSLNLVDPNISKAHNNLLDNGEGSWFTLGYPSDSKDQLVVMSCGEGGLDSIKHSLPDDHILFFILCQHTKLIEILWCPEVGGVKKARAMVHARAVAAHFNISTSNTHSASSVDDLSAAEAKNDTTLNGSAPPSRPPPQPKQVIEPPTTVQNLDTEEDDTDSIVDGYHDVDDTPQGVEQEDLVERQRIEEAKRIEFELEQKRKGEVEERRRVDEERRRVEQEHKIRVEQEQRMRVDAEDKRKAGIVKQKSLEQERMNKMISSGQVALMGKLSALTKSNIWRRRYFELSSKALVLYKEDLSSKTPIQAIPLNKSTEVVDSYEEVLVKNSFKLSNKEEDLFVPSLETQQPSITHDYPEDGRYNINCESLTGYLQHYRLQSKGGNSIDLPQIAVVGSQSSGKSSVLETIVGRDFLPRGSGIVTRRPLILQLIHTNKSQDYAEFLHMDKRYTDFEEVRSEIQSETFRVAGQNKGISKLPINLKIYSNNVVNLTLVDLPGLTKIPVGDQPSDIERQIRQLVLDFIQKPNCVILAVSPANVDLANSDSLKLARSVDPQGRRTIGVLTKLDLMDAGTHALDVLNGRVYPLKLGFIGVVNRSQQDINSNLDIGEARKREEEFFAESPSYRNIAHRCGTKYLAKTLNNVLMAHIREKLPDMKAKLNTLMGQTQQELNAFGDSTFFGKPHRASLILKLMTQFGRDFVSSVDGTSSEISTKELGGGARIYYIFNDVFGQALESINPNHNLSNHDIRTAIRNSTGPRPSLFVPEVAFELLVKPQIKLLEPPSLRCVELVYEELMKMCHNSSNAELARFPRLHAQLIEVVSDLLRERLGPTAEYVQSLIAIQSAYINTNHPSFAPGTAQYAAEAQKEKQKQQQLKYASMTSSIDEERERESEGERSSGAVDDSMAIEARPGNNAQNDVRHQSLTAQLLSGGGEESAFGQSQSQGQSQSHLQSQPHTQSRRRHGMQHPHAHTHAPSQSQTARDTFLNYFFGGADAASSVSNGASNTRTPVRDVDGEAREQRNYTHSHTPSQSHTNPLNGRSGLEGSAAAYDMKSLGRHLEPVPTIDEGGSAVSEREDMETTLIRSLIASYFAIVRQSIEDLVPKAIMHLLVNFSKDLIQDRLVASLYNPDIFDELLYEDENIVNERNRVKNLMDAYKQAFTVLAEVNMPKSGADSVSSTTMNSTV
ncbi:hypothetical protein E3P81_03165 [Wallemia ichthyophaga]|nr:hypothetical protein E3P98_02777 [Wallemia ichthyophaga]TIA89079.1 hypothetical protein E3P97_03245 [Wallemia ichthyophaga]TIB03872.1 hypothetical protein E3P96_01770 [Wallemia ichthyophaga]TIB30152.1 hypothetical protein E3P85_02857 [Wallemia ichthyophaga]TIB45024.1 hypothetical protein E3P82_03169 [Wallemia ichthyophaga]